MNRKIKVYLPKGTSKLKRIETEAETWGQLKLVLSSEGIDLENTKAIVGENLVTLESEDAKLPVGLSAGDEANGDFTLFLTPVKVKSGADVSSMGYTELRSNIKNLRDENEDAVQFFGNYTHSTTEELRDMLRGWYSRNAQLEASDSPVSEVIALLSNAIQILEDGIAEGRFEDPNEELKQLEEQWLRMQDRIPGI